VSGRARHANALGLIHVIPFLSALMGATMRSRQSSQSAEAGSARVALDFLSSSPTGRDRACSTSVRRWLKRRTAATSSRESALASTRLVIESVFANLKGQMRLEQHLAKTPAGLALRIAQRILALTIGILLKHPHRPPRTRPRRLRRPLNHIKPLAVSLDPPGSARGDRGMRSPGAIEEAAGCA
jgi:hypothetical protein